jgi:chorismate-pyruvate lyase
MPSDAAALAASLEGMFQQPSLTDALAQRYGEVRLEVRSQRETLASPPRFAELLHTRGPLLERRIRLHVRIAGDWKPIVCAVSWIDREALSVEARDALAAGKRMLGEILAAERELAIVEAGLESGVAPELAEELDAGPDTALLLRWRYWSGKPGRAAVLLLESARVTLPG